MDSDHDSRPRVKSGKLVDRSHSFEKTGHRSRTFGLLSHRPWNWSSNRVFAEALEQRGFADAIGTDKSGDLICLDVKRNVFSGAIGPNH